jgi:S-adenosylmethionine hydrolase
MRPMTILTDYGAGSEHVGALHAVVASRAPGVDRIDLAHDLPPGDVRYAATVLARLVPLAPVGVHLAVVDPGVGTTRRAVAIACTDGRMLVGPDNGLLRPAADALGIARAVELSSTEHRREVVAPTFHGRDVFAPAAAHLATGGELTDLGPGIEPRSLVALAVPRAEISAGRIATVVLGADRFGNVELIAGPADVADSGIAVGDAVVVQIAATTARGRVGEVFADVASGDVLVYVDSHRAVAVAVRDGNARELFTAHAGERVEIRVIDV